MNSTFKTGIIYSTLGKFSNLFVSLLVNATLSRLLSPSDYGVVAIVQVFIIFFQMLAEAGMGPAIIQNKQLTMKDVGILFNYSGVLAVILAITFGLFGQVLGFVYDNSIYHNLSWWQSISVLFSGLNVVPSAILNREKRFKEINFNQIIGSILSGCTGILLAFQGFGVYALIISAIVFSIVVFIRNMLAVKINFQNHLDQSVLNKILGFSVHQFFFNFINYFSRNADNILIGKYMGPTALGNYSKAYQLLMMPNNILLGIISPVLQPILSDYQDNVTIIRNEYMKIVRILALIGCGLSAFLSINSREIIIFMFGNSWNDAIFPFSVLSLTVWVQMTLSSTGAIFQSRNKSKELFTTGFLSATILVGGIIIGVISKDLNKFSIILAIAFYVNYLFNFSRVMKLALDANLIVLFSEIKLPILLGFVEYVILFICYKFVSHTSSFLSLFIMGLIYLVSYIGLITIFGELKRVKNVLKNS